jgi:hypothetical protein
VGDRAFQDPAEGFGIWIFNEAHGIEILMQQGQKEME